MEDAIGRVKDEDVAEFIDAREESTCRSSGMPLCPLIEYSRAATRLISRGGLKPDSAPPSSSSIFPPKMLRTSRSPDTPRGAAPPRRGSRRARPSCTPQCRTRPACSPADQEVPSQSNLSGLTSGFLTYMSSFSRWLCRCGRAVLLPRPQHHLGVDPPDLHADLRAGAAPLRLAVRGLLRLLDVEPKGDMFVSCQSM